MCNLLAVISIRYVSCVFASHALFLVSAILYVHMLSHPTSSDFIWEALVFLNCSELRVLIKTTAVIFMLT